MAALATYGLALYLTISLNVDERAVARYNEVGPAADC